MVFGFPLESQVPEALAPQPVLSPDHSLDCGISQPHTISPEQQCLSSLDLQSEPESNDVLGTATTKNAAAKGSAPDPVFIGIRAEKDTDVGGDRPLECDSESPDQCQCPLPAAGAGVSGLYIGSGL